MILHLPNYLQPILPHEFDYDSDVEEKMDWMEDKTKQVGFCGVSVGNNW